MENKKTVKTVVIIVAAVVLLAVLFISSIHVIPTGYTGVKETFGRISEKPLESGNVYLTIPFVEKILRVNNKQQEFTDNSKVWSETAERTAIYYEGVSVTYQISPDASVWVLSNVTDYRSNLLTSNLIASAIKASSKELNDIDATNRGIVEQLIQTNLQNSLDEKFGSKNVVIINKVTVSNVDFDDSYNDAIAAKQRAQIEAQQQEIENNKAIAKAEADAKVKRTEAQAKADALLIEAEAEAKANETLQQSLTDGILKQRYIEKWDGKLPTVSGDSDILIGFDSITAGNNTTVSTATE